MVPSAGKTVLRRGEGHKINIAELARDFGLATTAFEEEQPEKWYLRKWGVRPDDQDQRIGKILTDMHKLWPRLSAGHRDLYLWTAENIAKAERAKQTWNLKDSRKRYKRLSKTAVAAARLALEIAAIFPPPWTDTRAPIGTLVKGLTGLIGGSRNATFPRARNDAIAGASTLLRATKARILRKTGRMNWELVRGLAWLASGKKIELDERTVRRYLEKQRYAKDPVEDCWNRNLDLIQSALRLARPRCEPFESAAKKYLRTPTFSGASTERTAPTRR